MRKLIGMTGKKRSGKDTVSAVLVKEFNFKQEAFANALKGVVQILFPVLKTRHLWGEDKEEYITSLDASSRKLLQDIGIILRGYRENIWIDSVEAFIELAETPIVISDVRFNDEAAMIRRHGGEIWEVQRDNLNSVDTHVSEQGLTLPPDRIIYNNSTMGNLAQQVKEVMNSA